MRDKQADRCSPMSRRLVCVVSVSKLKGGGGFPGKLCEDLAWLVTMQQDGGGGGRGVSWRRRTAVTAHQWMAVVSRWPSDWFSSGSGSGFLDEDLNFSVSVINSTILSRPVSGDTFFSRLFSVFVLVGFLCFS